MNKRILKSFVVFVFLLPCVLLFAACGKIKKLDGETLVYSKMEVTGDLVKADYEDMYKTVSFVFDETTMTYKDGSQESVVHDYKLEKGKIYIKSSEDTDYSTTAYAEISGKFMVVTETYDKGTIKIYFKVK